MVEGAISVASPTMHPCQRRHQRFFRNPHTAAIQKLAADLGKNPHKIYQREIGVRSKFISKLCLYI